MEINNDPIIKELAEKLAYNLLSISFDEDNLLKSAKKEILNNIENIENFEKERFIVIVGAGISYNANNKIPLGKKGSDFLMKKYKKRFGILIENEIKKLAQVYKLDGNAFETKLLAINKYANDLYDEVKFMYDFRYYPNKFYELLAHLLKNRFVDIVVNFNFDELLDQAIKDEICSSEYIKVISDGDIPDYYNDLMKGDRFRVPLYVKPHGTVSHKTSLKFTREAYFNISSDINNFLSDLLSGKINKTEKKLMPVNLIVFGFNMESFEFNNLLIEKLPNNSNIYFFNDEKFNIKKFANDNNNNRLFIKYFKNNIKIIPVDEKDKLVINQQRKINVFNIKRIKKHKDYSTDNILETLNLKIKEIFKDLYYPRNIERHILISKLFSNKNGERDDFGHYNYFKDRVYVELLLLVAKSFGFVGLRQMTKDRVGIYYNLYKLYYEKLSKEDKEKEKFIPLYEFCDTIGLKRLGYSNDFYYLKYEEQNNKTTLTLDSALFIEYYINNPNKSIINRLKGNVSENLFDLIINKNKSCFEKTLIELYKSEDSEITPNYENIHNNIFVDPKIIKTKLALDYHTKSLFTEEKLNSWDVLFSIAETGEWLKKASNVSKFRNHKIALIVADEAFKSDLTNSNIIYNMPLKWWLHNQHMSIFLNKKENFKKGNFKKIKDWKDCFNQIKVIYFHRRNRSTLINPVILENEKDIELALKIFFAYMLKIENQNDLDLTEAAIEKKAKEYINKFIV